jgi:hypothetical protein
MDLTKALYVTFARALRAFARWLGLLHLLERNRHSRACLYMRSLFSIYDAEDLAYLDLPWWTFGAIDYLEAMLDERGSQMTVFEYGSGASTVWLARRCQAVYSVEHDPDWASQVRRFCAHHANVTISAIPTTSVDASTRCQSGRSNWQDLSFDRYVESIRAYPFNFDLIVVDGRCRADCLSEAQRKLNAGGVIVFDNSNRPRYRSALENSPLRRAIFSGLTPNLPGPGETTVFFASDVSANIHSAPAKGGAG